MGPGAIPPAGVVWLKNSARVARGQARQPRSGPTDDPSRHLAAPHRCPTAVVCGCRLRCLPSSCTRSSGQMLLTAIAAYVPLSLSFLPVLARLCGRRRESGRADAQATPVWPGYLAAATGIVMLAGYQWRPRRTWPNAAFCCCWWQPICGWFARSRRTSWPSPADISFPGQILPTRRRDAALASRRHDLTGYAPALSRC